MKKSRTKKSPNLFRFILTGVLLCTVSGSIYLYSHTALPYFTDTKSKVAAPKLEADSKQYLFSEPNWKQYTSDEIDFSYPEDWIIEQPSKTNTTGFYLVDYSSHNQKVWTLSRDGIGGYTTAIISIVKNYDPEPIVLKEDTARNKYLQLPNNTGYLEVYFSNTEYYPELSQEEFSKKIVEPFMQSIVLRELNWIETEPTIQSQETFNTTNWKTYVGERFTIQYPPGWYVDENWRIDSDHPNDIVIRKNTISSYFGFPSPAIIIGSGAVFSTSGALCGNGTCGPDVGVAEIDIKGKKYFARIIDKNGKTLSNSENRRDFFYIFRIVPENYDSDMYITTTFANFNQGQEIANILSTLEDTESY